ncbi:site-specific integrase [Halolactibacillus miurensis]|uniref:Site-specific integrase n=2 Tax=Halolactibacillus miurensis TaxID=306541 RepID=A0A1I6SFK1_9BACI|nr:site-specific integrase [Halolactibacillus miurensis]GEM05931.1 site-specific integrase [Halolactibacillus miurensis]SFS75717.1 Site-specific recombinase XerD [Halolactibacillus miurensis]
MASYDDLGFGKFKIYVELGYDERGKRRRKTKTVTATSQRDLNKKIRDFEIECFNTKDEPVDNITFSSFVDRWMKNYVDINLMLTTKESYEYLLDHCGVLDYFGKIKMKDIKKYHIVEYLAKESKEGKPLMPNKFLLIKSIFGRALEWDVINQNPTIGVKGPKREKKKTDYYNEDELNHLFGILDDCHPKHRIAIKLAAIGGLRRAEILGIREECINFENNSIYVDKQLRYDKNKHEFYLSSVKNRKPRMVYFPSTFMQELKVYYTNFKARRLQMGNLWRGIYDEEGNMINLLLVKEDGYPTHLNTLSNEWRKIINRHKLKDISFHQLRHSCASLMVKKGINYKVIQERLGHANISITLDTYSHLEEDQHIESVNVFEKLL